MGAAAAALATLINGWLQTRSATRIARVNLIMPMRVEWIGQLRGKVARYITACAKINIEKKRDWELPLLRHEIALMLNLDEEEHQQLEEALKQLVQLAEEKKMDDPEVGDAVVEVRRLTSSILKTEWERAKKGDEKPVGQLPAVAQATLPAPDR